MLAALGAGESLTADAYRLALRCYAALIERDKGEQRWSKRAGELLDEALARNLASGGAAGCVAEALARTGRVEEAAALVERCSVGAVRGFTLSPATFEGGPAGRNFWRKMYEFDGPVDSFVFNAFLRLCLVCLDTASKELAPELSAAGLQPDASGVATLLRRRAEATGTPFDSCSFGTVIAHFAFWNEADKAREWLEDARRRGLADFACFAPLLRCGDVPATRALLEAMRAGGYGLEGGVRPFVKKHLRPLDEALAGSLVVDLASALALVGRLDEAAALARAHLEANPSDGRCLVSLLSLSAGRGDWAAVHAFRAAAGSNLDAASRRSYLRLCLASVESAAKALAPELSAAGLQPDANGVATMLRRQAQEAGADFDARAFSSVIAHLIAENRIAEARAWLEAARAAKAADLPCFGYFLRGAARSGDVQEMHSLLEAMEADGFGLQGDARSFVDKHVIRRDWQGDLAVTAAVVVDLAQGLAMTGQWQRAADLTRACLDADHRFDQRCITSLIASSAERKNWAAGRAFWGLAQSSGKAPSAATLGAYLKLCLACLDSAVQVLAPELSAAGLQPDASGVATLLRRQAQQSGADFSSQAFNSVILHLIAENRAVEARAWLDAAREARAADLPCFCYFLRNAARLDSKEEARSVLEAMEADGYRLQGDMRSFVDKHILGLSGHVTVRAAVAVDLAKGLVVVGRLEHAVSLIRACLESSARFDHRIVASVIASSADRRDWAAGRAFWDLARATTTSRSAAALGPCRVAFLKLCLACVDSAVQGLAPELSAAGLQPDADGIAELLRRQTQEAPAGGDSGLGPRSPEVSRD